RVGHRQRIRSDGARLGTATPPGQGAWKKISKTHHIPKLQPCSAAIGALEGPVRPGCNQIDEEPLFFGALSTETPARGRIRFAIFAQQ
ncbi:MAG: hypothetical protein ACJ8GN_24945, partial [Longimicrobiaceae bacterium]